MQVKLIARVLLYWYIFIFFSTELLSYFNLLERRFILPGEISFWTIVIFRYKKEILNSLKSINLCSKSVLFILTLFILTFIQGFFSAPSTTDSMVYHLPRVMYWVQEKTLDQDIVRNPHDFMAPFGEYILLHLYFITGNDRLLFFSQWISYVVVVILSFVIAKKLGGDKKMKNIVALFMATLPIAVLQASSTQVDMVVANLTLVSSYLAIMLSEKVTIRNSVLFALALGLGISTKTTFYLYMVIPLGLALYIFMKKKWRQSLIIVLTGVITLIMPFRIMAQNLRLFGNVLGPSEENGGLILTNDSFDLITLSSNLTRNVMLHMPVPYFSSQVQDFLEFIHKLLGISINAPETTCCDFQFRVNPILYPQEDIIVNPLHLLLITISIFLVFGKKVNKERKLVLMFSLSLISFAIFSLVLKWQPFHSRLQIPFFVIGTISSVLILSKFKKGLFVLKTFLTISILLAVLLIFLNVSRPFISYTLFYNFVSGFTRPNASVPEAFFLKPRIYQYFNPRFYWFWPYNEVTDLLKGKPNVLVSLDLSDNYEYPLWVMLKDKNIDFKMVPLKLKNQANFLIKTSSSQTQVEGYGKIGCYKTEIDYGYACLYKR